MTAANREPAAVATATASDTSDRELVATRVFDAPGGWSSRRGPIPKHLGQWWGPRGFTTTTASMDVRPGGVWRFCMHGPDGTDYQNRITYTEVVDPSGSASSTAGAGRRAGQPQPGRSFEDVGGKTKLTMRDLPVGRGTATSSSRSTGPPRLVQTIDRLAESTQRRSADPPTKPCMTCPSDLEFRLTRTFDAPRGLVWEAMTSPSTSRSGGARRPDADDLRDGPARRRRLAVRPSRARRPRTTRSRGTTARSSRPSGWSRPSSTTSTSSATRTRNDDPHRAGRQDDAPGHVQHDSQQARDGHLHSGMEGGAASPTTASQYWPRWPEPPHERKLMAATQNRPRATTVLELTRTFDAPGASSSRRGPTRRLSVVGGARTASPTRSATWTPGRGEIRIDMTGPMARSTR